MLAKGLAVGCADLKPVNCMESKWLKVCFVR